ncbi:MAG: PepSY-like domain-containing protein, partial [Oleispira sp.]|nr:PepSY-like domain-containing protein [Oleispira sp.]
EVEFDINRVEYSAHFLADGTWRKTEHEIKKKAIPKNIKRILKSEFSKYKIVEAEFVETPKGIFYEFGLKKGKIEIDVAIDNTAKIIKKEIKENRD